MRIDLKTIDIVGRLPDYNDRLYAAATMYVENGFAVLPVRPGTKALPPGVNYNMAAISLERVKKWWGPDGTYEGYGVSLAGGLERLAIVDLDVKGNGIMEWEGLVCASLLDFAPRAVTPSGGSHLLFKWFVGAESHAAKLAPGIDMRGGTAKTSTGHALVWPTVYEGKEYVWASGGPVKGAPEVIRERARKVTSIGRARKKVVGGRGQIDEDDEIEVVTLEELRSIIKDINIGSLSYDEWLRVGMSIHSHQPNEEGCRIWDAWSSQEPDRYVAGDCASKWASFTRPGTLTVGTLKMYAKASKLNLTPTQYSVSLGSSTEQVESQITDLMDELNASYGFVIHGNKGRILVQRHNRGPMDRGYDLIGKEDFMNKMLSKRVGVITAAGKMVERTYADIWLADARRKDYGGIVMDPSKAKEFMDRGDLMYNMWCGWTVEPAEGDWSLFRDHIHKVICAGKDDLTEWVLDWMAYAVQKPDKIPGTALVLRGGEGAGKGTFAHTLGKLFGRHYRHLTQHEHLVGKFNSMLEDAVLVFADEVTYGGDRRTAGVLKGYVTEPTINVERKGLEATTFKNNIHLIIASNEDWVVPAGPTARRWMCLDVSKDHMQDRSYFGAMLKQIDNGGLEGMFHDLLQREIKNDIAVAPTTAMRDEQKAEYITGDSVQKWWSAILSNGQIPFGLASKVNPGEEDLWPEDGKFKAQIAFAHYEEWTLKRNMRLVSEYKFYTRLYEYGLQKRKSQGVNYTGVRSLKVHKELFTKAIGFDVFSIHDTEERDDEKES